MSRESDLIQHPSTESTDELSRPGPFFDPLPQYTDAPPPELFDQEVAELDSFLQSALEQFDEYFTAVHHSIPAISTPPPLTYSTICVYGANSSHHSSDF